MTYKLSFIALITLTTVSFFSCKKGGSSPISNIPKVKSITFVDTSGSKVRTLQYNKDGFIAKQTDWNGSVVTYEYFSDKIVEKRLFDNKLVASFHHFFNNDKLIDSSIVIWEPDGIIVPLSSYSYSNKQLIVSRGYDQNNNLTGITYITYQNNNLRETKEFAANGTLTRTTFFSHDSLHTSTRENENFGKSWLGKGNNNPIISQHIIVPDTSYSYTWMNFYDNAGRIERVETSTNSILYTYY